MKTVYHPYEVTLAVGTVCIFEQKTLWGNINKYRDPEIRYKETEGKIASYEYQDNCCVIETIPPQPHSTFTLDIDLITSIPYIDTLRKTSIYKLIENQLPDYVPLLFKGSIYAVFYSPSQNTIIRSII